MSTQAQQQEIQETDFNKEDAVQYLTFRLDGEAFATEIDNVREVLEYTRITRVPRTPEYMLGVINLRGSIVPVVDLRLQFGMPVARQTVDTCIIIIEVNFEGSLTVLGTLADSVQEVVDLLPEHLSPAPTLGTRINNEYISAMGKIEERFVMILDLDVIFSIDAEVFTSLADMYHQSRIEQIKSVDTNEFETDDIEDGVVLETENQQNDMAESDVKEPVSVGIDLDSAIQKHAQWKLKLHSAISKKENLEASEIIRDDCCVLGKWLHGEARSKFSELNSYIECVKKHKAFHTEAGKVAQTINAKLYSQAEAMLGQDTSYITASKEVASAIVSLRKEIE